MDITITTRPDGGIEASTIVNNDLYRMTYYGYSKKDAKTRFKKMMLVGELKDTINGN